MYYSDDPAADADRYYSHLESQLADLPHCVNCGEPIQDDYAYEFEDGLWCEACVEEHRKRIY